MPILISTAKRFIAATVCVAMTCVFTITPAFAANDDAPDQLAPEQLEQLVAPIALYPDALLSQILMASTYPLEVVQADRWRQAQPANMAEPQIADAVANQPWDPSVKSLAPFPDVLRMMSNDLDWMQNLGDAFLGQEKDVMDAVQRLRERAQAAGNLRSGPQQTVQVSGSPPLIEIAPAQPETVYVPVYNPTVVYGPWPYPAYQPYYYRPPGFPVAAVALSFGVGFVVGNALWGHPDWRRGRVNINVNHYNRYNHTRIVNNHWSHDPAHRGDVRYRSPSVARRYQSAAIRHGSAGYHGQHSSGPGHTPHGQHGSHGQSPHATHSSNAPHSPTPHPSNHSGGGHDSHSRSGGQPHSSSHGGGHPGGPSGGHQGGHQGGSHQGAGHSNGGHSNGGHQGGHSDHGKSDHGR